MSTSIDYSIAAQDGSDFSCASRSTATASLPASDIFSVTHVDFSSSDDDSEGAQQHAIGTDVPALLSHVAHPPIEHLLLGMNMEHTHYDAQPAYDPQDFFNEPEQSVQDTRTTHENIATLPSNSNTFLGGRENQAWSSTSTGSSRAMTENLERLNNSTHRATDVSPTQDAPQMGWTRTQYTHAWHTDLVTNTRSHNLQPQSYEINSIGETENRSTHDDSFDQMTYHGYNGDEYQEFIEQSPDGHFNHHK